uniref:CaiB/BaiF CoA transferase family protein n=1 Tax=Marinobacterium profundum TaxID=1714300 RepID=UPI0008328EAA|nr:CoA transferase [Marinobacterium profundum]
MSTPLAGFRVLDLTNVLAGPFCCHQLAHLGAEVIKIERPGSGDLARQLGADADLNREFMGVSFLAQNAGKLSVTLDLKNAQDKEQFIELVKSADVLVENYRPGVMKRLGLDFEKLKQVNERLVYCAISGFGQDGPLANYPAYDQIIQGMSGVMSITGAPENAPYRVGFPLADTIGGLTAAMAINAILAESPRQARFIDISMLDSVLATMGWAVSNLLVAGRQPNPLGNDNVTASPSGTFKTGDGLLNIAANKQEQFEALCRVLGQAAWISDARFKDRHARLENRRALAELIEASLAQNTTEHWWKFLVDAGVPAGPVYSVAEALNHPQVRDRGVIERFEDTPIGRPIEVVSGGYRIDGQPPRVATAPPVLGADNAALLQAYASNKA